MRVFTHHAITPKSATLTSSQFGNSNSSATGFSLKELLILRNYSEPAPASIEDVRLVHTDDYVSRLCDGTLTDKEIRRLGLPWSESLVTRSFYAVGGTIAAALQSLNDGYSSNLAGGTHHSFPDRGGRVLCIKRRRGLQIRTLRSRGLIRRAAIVDCDVHQGNGTATIFAEDT